MFYIFVFQLEEERAKKENVSPTKLPPVIEAQEPADAEAAKTAEAKVKQKKKNK